jgi:hypothetical protein
MPFVKNGKINIQINNQNDKHQFTPTIMWLSAYSANKKFQEQLRCKRVTLFSCTVMGLLVVICGQTFLAECMKTKVGSWEMGREQRPKYCEIYTKSLEPPKE